SPSMDVYPNPVVGRILQIQFSGYPSGTYSLALYDGKGQQFSFPVIQIQDGQSIHSIKIPQLLSTGIYRLKVIGPGNTRATKTINISDQ
ncbi:MAG: T9SS type A sorting domain-containing protein, partial [Ferruginibacter sp.]